MRLSPRDKIIVLVALAGVAVIVASTLLYPKFAEDSEKTNELSARKTEFARLQEKIKDSGKAEQDKVTLENQISALRTSVPKTPELDLLLIDIEKMCTVCGIELVAIETPSPDTLREIHQAEQDLNNSASAGKPAVAGNTKKPDKPTSIVEEASLKNVIKQVYVSGDYPGLVAFMKMLESYQRIVGISQVSLAVKAEQTDAHTAATERVQRLPLKKPLMAFLLTVYYLP